MSGARSGKVTASVPGWNTLLIETCTFGAPVSESSPPVTEIGRSTSRVPVELMLVQVAMLSSPSNRSLKRIGVALLPFLRNCTSTVAFACAVPFVIATPKKPKFADASMSFALADTLPVARTSRRNACFVSESTAVFTAFRRSSVAAVFVATSGTRMLMKAPVNPPACVSFSRFASSDAVSPTMPAAVNAALMSVIRLPRVVFVVSRGTVTVTYAPPSSDTWKFAACASWPFAGSTSSAMSTAENGERSKPSTNCTAPDASIDSTLDVLIPPSGARFRSNAIGLVDAANALCSRRKNVSWFVLVL